MVKLIHLPALTAFFLSGTLQAGQGMHFSFFGLFDDNPDGQSYTKADSGWSGEGSRYRLWVDETALPPPPGKEVEDTASLDTDELEAFCLARSRSRARIQVVDYLGGLLPVQKPEDRQAWRQKALKNLPQLKMLTAEFDQKGNCDVFWQIEYTDLRQKIRSNQLAWP